MYNIMIFLLLINSLILENIKLFIILLLKKLLLKMLTKKIDKNLDDLIINLKITKPTSIDMFIKMQ